ncbi:MAG: pantoate--beta-alanine ligase [bacterium]|nr:pantoate--beta-alanine ligase [bacterium]MDT8365052.1 pantoate--beta-alanine ligase [bacterium]
MKIITTISEMYDHSDRLREQGDRIGFVPTMGFLHEGHLSLMRKAREENHALIVSIFVNPTQFGPDEDYDSYPRDLESDASLCREVGCDVLFTPGADEMYPQGTLTTVSVAGLTETLCGASRPGHFDGVTTVVSKLFNIVRPHMVYFGLKDYQQYRVISRMVQDLNMNIRVIGVPTVREEDGLAMSSRNARLYNDERAGALTLSRSLDAAREMIREGVRDPRAIEKKVAGIIESESTNRIDYVSVVNADDLTPLSSIEKRALLAMAVFLGDTRLIDNTVLEISGD